MSQINQSIDLKCHLKYTELSVIDNNLLSQIKVVIIHNDIWGTENIIITKSDEIFGFGTNYCGRLGLGVDNKVGKPTKIPELSAKKVIKVRFGIKSMVALTELGEVYTSGYDSNPILINEGLTPRNGPNKPEKINTNNELIIDIKCNSGTTLLTQTNQIYWFTKRLNISLINTPTHLINLNNEQIIQISCGYRHLLALTHTGNTYAWNFNSIGELSLGDNNSVNPQQIQIHNEFVKQIASGYQHSLLLTSNARLYSFGFNQFGQLGTGNTLNENLPKYVTLVSEKIIEIFAINFISMALTENQTIYVWGQTKQIDRILSPLKTNLNSFQEAIDFYCKQLNTYKPMTLTDILIKRRLNRVMQTMAKAFNDSNNFDLEFKIKRKGSSEYGSIYVHKWFIEKNSEHFQKMFANQWIENQSNEILINAFSYEAYYQYIKSLYTDSIETEDIQLLTEFLSITEQYLDEEMKLKCVEKIESLTTSLNVCTIYSYALKYRSKQLEDYCFEVISNNIKSISYTEDYDQMDSTYFKHFATKYFQQK